MEPKEERKEVQGCDRMLWIPGSSLLTADEMAEGRELAKRHSRISVKETGRIRELTSDELNGLVLNRVMSAEGHTTRAIQNMMKESKA